jgi:DNA-binding NtrC family response regulator
MRQGAMDFLTKPVTADQLLRRIRDYRKAPPPARELLGHSAQAEQLRQLAAQAAQVRSTVMIIGETGTGRRHLARHLHERGPDAALPLLTLSPSAEIDPQAVEGAGALLIPSVDDWPPEALDRLQRALERLEAGQPPRVIATASPQVDLRAARGDLSPELYFRLAVLMVRIPPLRARPEDALVLLEHFLRSHAQLFNKPLPALAADQREALLRHSWPGNIREVANLAERAVVLGTAQLHVESRPTAPDSEALPPGFQLPEHLERIERELLERAIAQTGGDRPAISRLLGVERNTLRYKLNKYGLLDRTTT